MLLRYSLHFVSGVFVCHVYFLFEKQAFQWIIKGYWYTNCIVTVRAVGTYWTLKPNLILNIGFFITHVSMCTMFIVLNIIHFMNPILIAFKIKNF